MVLIARLDDGRTLYAVEREDRGLYVLCQLGSWVNMRQLRSASVASKHDVSTSSETNSTTTNPTGAPPHTVSESSKYSKKKRLAIEAIQSMVKRPSTGLLTDSQPTSEQEPVPDTEQGHALPSPHLDPVAQPTSNDIFETVRNQYFEALYLSKVGSFLYIVNDLTIPGFTGIFCKRAIITSSGSVSP
jgi:DNA replication regulator SLD3